MLIDWFTIAAQVLNFLVLAWLMKRFLYKPILNAIDSRETRIAKELADAAASQAEARKEREEFQHKNEEFDTQRAELLSQAADEANAERQRLLGEASKAADELIAKRQKAMKSDARSLEHVLSRRAQQEVFAIARKAMRDLAATSLEGRMVEAFTLRLRGMDGQDKASMGEALTTASKAAIVRSAFDLPQEQREAVRKAINETFSADVHLRFETAPELVSGIDLSANGQRVAWNIGAYLGSLSEGLNQVLKEQERPEANAEPSPRAMAGQTREAAVAQESEARVVPTSKDHAESTSESPAPEPQST